MNKLIQEIVAEGIEEFSQTDERLELLTVTDVNTDPDLRRAVVFYSARREGADTALEEHRIALQSQIGRQTTMKRTPQLVFEIDKGMNEGWRIEEILRQMKDDHPDE
ncbi:MAG: ribosome-binding factor A [Acidimicrobiales bacterium]